MFSLRNLLAFSQSSFEDGNTRGALISGGGLAVGVLAGGVLGRLGSSLGTCEKSGSGLVSGCGSLRWGDGGYVHGPAGSALLQMRV